MTTREHFRQIMRERRLYLRGTTEWEWRTRAARKLAWIVKGRPANTWGVK